ncbi:MAG TPA: hypothetical protein VLE47_04120 [Candidatus Saccharimonadales bacterium]|nr:hypothetical protein [Candidatus Saccharimonadales bacterium]
MQRTERVTTNPSGILKPVSLEVDLREAGSNESGLLVKEVRVITLYFVAALVAAVVAAVAVFTGTVTLAIMATALAGFFYGLGIVFYNLEKAQQPQL